MASTTTTHQRSASATINPSTLIESCHVYPLLATNNNNHKGGGSSPNCQSKQRTTSHTRLLSHQTEVDPASTEDSHLPVCFCEKRHVQPIEGIKCITQSWRMKERVSV